MIKKRVTTICKKATLLLSLFIPGISYGQTNTAIEKNEALSHTISNHTNFPDNSAKDSLIKELFVIDDNDQKYRNQLDEVRTKYGGDATEMKDLIKLMTEADSIDLIKVTAILDKYGWLGPGVIGGECNTTLFMVIQHSDLKVQEKYLPMMRRAVKNGQAKANSLALLEDRVALRQGKKQTYGSQVSWNMITNRAYVAPLADPDNVDKRRAEVGLPPLAGYLAGMDVKWDIEQYKKDLPAIEAEFFKK